jgi:hypothetical protein
LSRTSWKTWTTEASSLGSTSVLPILSSRLIKETFCRSAVKFPSSLVKRLCRIGVETRLKGYKYFEIERDFLINLVSRLMGILNLVYCYLFLFVSLSVIQAIYIEMFFRKESMSLPFSSFPWILAENSLFWLRVFIRFMFKSVNLSILQKTINKTSKSPHTFAMYSNRTDFLKQENEKVDSL